MNKYPLISIITATFNSGDVLEELIRSVISQTYNNYEFIIIDGHSTDATVNIIEKYQQHIKYWISEPDTGIYEAWNKGLKVATGEWIAFIGSDDVFLPNALQDYVNFINSLNEPKLEYVSSKIHLVRKDGKLIKTYGQPWVWNRSKLINTIAHPGSLHHRSLFDTYGDFNTKYRICSDYEFLLRPGINFVTAFLDKVTVKMAQGGASFNETKLFREHYDATITTGKQNRFIAKYVFLKHMLKSYVKRSLRIFGVNI
ncbi:glycosyltransferase [Agrobacterium tumefaciens]|nr:glycosyltransferase [Agrobacterium tumefaciens]NTE21962.1 glycosyltransferase [Agrobacterium tumefaciens]